MDVKAYSLLLVAIVIGVVGQLLLRHGMSRCPGFRLAGIVGLIRNRPVVAGFICYGASTLLYLHVLASIDLSIAYPTVSLGYVLVMVMSKVLFKELIRPAQWGAVLIICAGVALVGLGSW